MKKLISVLVAAFLVSGVSIASTGEKSGKAITGRVIEMVEGKSVPVPFACVYCEGTTNVTYTDENGNFRMPVKKNGRYKVRFSHAGYGVVEKKIKVKDSTKPEEHTICKEVALLSQK